MLIQSLPGGPLDIVGDIHGEYAALRSLLAQLGYDDAGAHAEGRRLVFVGDLCDRGLDSPGVIRHVRRLVQAGAAQAIMGNHELNLLRGQRKSGNDWFWGERAERDRVFGDFAVPSPAERDEALAFMSALPLALERADLRVVHAAWHAPSVERLRASDDGSAAIDAFRRWESRIQPELEASGLYARYREQRHAFAMKLLDPKSEMPMLDAVGDCNEARQMGNPVRVMTSGVERKAARAFFSSGEWRFVDRVRWWDEYGEPQAVVVGHYWRELVPVDRARMGKGGPDLFEAVDPLAWHGRGGRVFCVDFSVGGRYQERRQGRDEGFATRLAALRWPERTLMLETGETLATTGFGG